MPLPALLADRLRLPLVAAPMFLVSNPDLVAACCRDGIVGSFPALNQRESSGFKTWLEEIEQLLCTVEAPAPYAVNLIVHQSNPRLQADLAICVEQRVPIIITSLGAVKEVVDAVHSYGGLVFHDVTTRRHAEKAADAGVDGLIAVAAGAGGACRYMEPFCADRRDSTVLRQDLAIVRLHKPWSRNTCSTTARCGPRVYGHPFHCHSRESGVGRLQTDVARCACCGHRPYSSRFWRTG